MCYSAQVRAEHKKFQRVTGSKMTVKEYVRLYWLDEGMDPYAKRPRTPRAMDIGFLRDGPEEVAELIRLWDAKETADLERELFAQRKRVADAERKLLIKVTKKAQEDVRIGTNKLEQIREKLDALRRTEPKASDQRMFPGSFCHVLVSEGGERVMRPMRYQCRLAGKPSSYDRDFSGTYNARRDNLEGFWRGQFGHAHGLIVADVFYENVQGPDGKNRVLAFTPRTGERCSSRACIPTGRTPRAKSRTCTPSLRSRTSRSRRSQRRATTGRSSTSSPSISMRGSTPPRRTCRPCTRSWTTNNTRTTNTARPHEQAPV